MKTLLFKKTITSTILCLILVLFNVGLYAQYPIVTSPNGGEYWQAGSVHNILWQVGPPPSLADINIDYSTDNGTSWINIDSYAANIGTYSWTTPNTPSTQCLVRIGADVSNNVFTIIGTTNIEESQKNDTYDIYPNPCNGHVNLKVINPSCEMVCVEIININGLCVYSKLFHKKTTEQIDLTNYAKGMYFIKILENNVVKTEKLIIN